MHSDFFAGNRRSLVKSLHGGLVVLGAYTGMQAQNDSAATFHQEANFWYLTGIDWPDWLVIIDGASGDEWLVAPTVDQSHQTFDGVLDFTRATATSGIRKILSRDDGVALLHKLARKHSIVHTIDNPPYAEHFGFALNPNITATKRILERIFGKVIDCQKDLAKLRAIKQPAEIAAMRRAIALTVKTFQEVATGFADFRTEYEIDAQFTYRFRQANATHAYAPIVAGGLNACTLHYDANADKIGLRDMVVMDIGARVDGYAADITRTYAKRPTSRARQVYEAVESAHHEIIGLIQPGLALVDYSAKVDEIMKRALNGLGLLADLSDVTTYRKYFPHAVSHGLGIDVHDSLGGARYLEPGMVLTVEPGVYIPEESIGVRIEDDILVMESGRENLSSKLSTSLI